MELFKNICMKTSWVLQDKRRDVPYRLSTYKMYGDPRYGTLLPIGTLKYTYVTKNEYMKAFY